MPAAEPTPPPLAALAAQRIVVVPTQRLREAGALGWLAQAGVPRDYLAGFDAAIAAALAERGAGGSWVMPQDVLRSARRNPTYATDPYALAVSSLEPSRRPPPRDAPLAEPLASQLRAIVALGDARYVLLPVELRFERVTPPAGAAVEGGTEGGRAVLRVALVDARLAQVRWAGDVASEGAAAFSPALATSVAARLADLIAPR